jgi:hypothetical protein
MRFMNRIVGAVLISCVSAAPLGVAAEGYVCASGVRMVHDASAPACTNCRPAAPQSSGQPSPAQAAFERPCCIYVGSTSLPPVLTVAPSGALAAQRSVPVATPGVTAIAGPATALDAIPQFESGGSGSSPPVVSLQRSLQLRN